MGAWRRLCLTAAVLLLPGCGGGGSSPVSATVAEGRRAVQDVMASTQASSVSVVLVDRQGLLWTEAFGQADRAASRPATPATLYGACSVSKMFATAAVMQLVDQGRISLDEPVVTYLPAFSMPLDPRYRDLTVRMLVNHSSGLPTHDLRSVTLAPNPDYGAQVLAGLRNQRLAYPPGTISSYNNEGFTLVESLVAEVSGQAFPAYVRANLLAPLGMAASQYMDAALPETGLARAYDAAGARPAYCFNMYGSGGLFTTPGELSHFAIMALNGGTWGGRRILSAAALAAMAEDQRLGSFNPVSNETFRFGLGWDTVASPGFAQLGIRAWQKTGDFPGYYGTDLVVLPDEGLAAVVFGATGTASSSFGSTHAARIAERILLRALVERGRLAALPAALATADLPVQAPSTADQADFAGPYAGSNGICRVSFAGDGSLSLDIFSNGWSTVYQGFKLRSDGWFAADGDPVTALRPLRRAGSTWLAQRQKGASDHYTVSAVMAQGLATWPALSAAWNARLGETWLPVDKELFVSYPSRPGDPSFRLQAIPGLDGYVAGAKILRDLDPASDDRLDGFFLTVPDAERGLQDVAVETRGGEAWLRAGCQLYRPRSTVPALVAPGTATLTIGAEGLAEWRSLPAGGRAAVSGATWWCIYDPAMGETGSGFGDGSAVLSGSGTSLLVVFAPAGAGVQVTLGGS
jgi:CubicO group peptidase (beta-lactamase class C family)